jgi:TM2 domain-containing membrane protein YozV
MKISYKAALLSALVFPGVGQLYLKKFWRGMVIMLIILTGLGYIILSVAISALSILDDSVVKLQNGATNLQELYKITESKMINTYPYHDAVFYLVVCFWIFAVIDAYIIGKEKESRDKETSPL